MKKKIAFLNTQDPRDKRSWSGILYFMLNELEKDYEVEWIGKSSVNRNYYRAIKLFYRLLFRKTYFYTHTFFYAKHSAKDVEKALEGKNYDCIFAPVASSSVAFLKTDIPIVYYTDATVASLNNYYDIFSNLTRHNLKEANTIEGMALNKSNAVVFSSQWAKTDSLKHYDFNSDKASVIPMGANLSEIPVLRKDVKAKDAPFKLLFLGVFWARKGGDTVLETFKELRAAGYDVELTICGCVPPQPVNDPKITVIPFLNKNIPEDRNRLYNLLHESDLLFLPTKADCSPIVFCEAMAYGLVSLSTTTGGVTELIKHGVNGYALPLGSSPSEYAGIIKQLINDPSLMQTLKSNSRRMYEEVFNWQHWGNEIRKVLENQINQRPKI